jgi:G3E family GTPase
MRDLLESQRRTDGIFRIAGIMAIDESRFVLYAGSMGSQFGTQVAPAWYTQSSYNIRTEGIRRSEVRIYVVKCKFRNSKEYYGNFL